MRLCFDVLMRFASEAAAGPFRLRDGRLVWLRPVHADDAARLVELCGRSSEVSLRRRFLRSIVNCQQIEPDRLANVDQVHHVAIAAVPDSHADGPILGVGRFHGNGSGNAELALFVADDYQGVGLGRVLLGRLLREAKRRGVRVFDGFVLLDNKPILKLLRSSGRRLDVDWYSGNVLSFKLHLQETAA